MKKSHPSRPAPAAPRLEEVRLADLKAHPDQGKYFRRYGEFEYAALKADIRAHGLKTPPEVLPPDNAAGLPAYTLLKGHTRVKVLGELGHAAVRANVRYDLAAASRADVDREFILDNVARRHGSRSLERDHPGRVEIGGAVGQAERHALCRVNGLRLERVDRVPDRRAAHADGD